MSSWWTPLYSDEEEEMSEVTRRIRRLHSRGIKLSVGPLRDVPESLEEVRAGIQFSRTMFWNRWLGQPRSDYEWELYYADEAMSQEYDTIEKEYWHFVRYELRYLLALEEYYKVSTRINRKRKYENESQR